MKTRVFPDPVENCGIGDTVGALLRCGKSKVKGRTFPPGLTIF
jgi:hypothetical protein